MLLAVGFGLVDVAVVVAVERAEVEQIGLLRIAIVAIEVDVDLAQIELVAAVEFRCERASRTRRAMRCANAPIGGRYSPHGEVQVQVGLPIGERRELLAVKGAVAVCVQTADERRGQIDLPLCRARHHLPSPLRS